MTGTQLSGQPPPARSRRQRALVVAAGLIGLALLAYVIADVGVARMVADVARLGAVLPMVLALSGIKFVLQTVGWRLVLRRGSRPRIGPSLSATVSGDALGYVTWAGQLTGEPMRALLLRDSVPLATGIAAGAVERAVYNITAAVLVWVVLLALLSGAHPVWATVAALASVAMAAKTASLIARALRPRPPSEAVRPTPEVPLTSRTRTRLVSRTVVDGTRALWRDRRSVLPALVALTIAQHALLVTEAYLMLGALGAAPRLSTALVFEAVTKIVNTAGVVVPARLGVSEAGSAAVAAALGLAASHGLSLALMRRARSLIWAAVGIALVPLQEARAQAAARPR